MAALACSLGTPVILVSPDYIPGEIAKVTIKWSGIPSPTNGDYIGVFSPGDVVSGSGSEFAKRQPWTKLLNTDATSSGVADIELLNWRSTYRFVYFNAAGAPVAMSNVVSANQDFPMHIHLALGDRPNSMRVMWITGSNDTTAQINYGFSPSQLIYTVRKRRIGQDTSFVLTFSSQVYGSSSSYDVSELCGLEAAEFFLPPGVIHDAQLNFLPPNTMVWYQVNTASRTASPVYSFKTAPLVGPDVPVSMFAFGDSGVSYCQNMSGWCEPNSQLTYVNIKSDMEANSNFSLLIQYVLYSPSQSSS